MRYQSILRLDCDPFPAGRDSKRLTHFHLVATILKISYTSGQNVAVVLQRSKGVLRLMAMNRSSISYLGIALLLWMGIILPATQQAVPDYEPTSSIESVVSAAAPDNAAASVPRHFIGNANCAADPDLSHITLALCPAVVTEFSFWSKVVATNESARSRSLSPDERPPKADAA
ncbi:hypothetical protein [Chelatococcus reniformis]|uniref:Uncharacterized protein n=1 Tax=Chelatococcus reniformis TaxID=1494448 RepID=A0A916XHN8_9HYPH|nr:hypothetical protein [Chelatococcus reniformis]GGC72508.1 hypothetical protein GCM10010994_33650 [Chelatococcus reniformis]